MADGAAAAAAAAGPPPCGGDDDAADDGDELPLPMPARLLPFNVSQLFPFGGVFSAEISLQENEKEKLTHSLSHPPPYPAERKREEEEEAVVSTLSLWNRQSSARLVG